MVAVAERPEVDAVDRLVDDARRARREEVARVERRVRNDRRRIRQVGVELRLRAVALDAGQQVGGLDPAVEGRVAEVREVGAGARVEQPVEGAARIREVVDPADERQVERLGRVALGGELGVSRRERPRLDGEADRSEVRLEDADLRERRARRARGVVQDHGPADRAGPLDERPGGRDVRPAERERVDVLEARQRRRDDLVGDLAGGVAEGLQQSGTVDRIGDGPAQVGVGEGPRRRGIQHHEALKVPRVDEVLLPAGRRRGAPGAVIGGEAHVVGRRDAGRRSTDVGCIVGETTLDLGRAVGRGDVQREVDLGEVVRSLAAVARVLLEHERGAGRVRGDVVGAGGRDRRRDGRHRGAERHRLEQRKADLGREDRVGFRQPEGDRRAVRRRGDPVDRRGRPVLVGEGPDDTVEESLALAAHHRAERALDPELDGLRRDRLVRGRREAEPAVERERVRQPVRRHRRHPGGEVGLHDRAPEARPVRIGEQRRARRVLALERRRPQGTSRVERVAPRHRIEGQVDAGHRWVGRRRLGAPERDVGIRDRRRGDLERAELDGRAAVHLLGVDLVEAGDHVPAVVAARIAERRVRAVRGRHDLAPGRHRREGAGRRVGPQEGDARALDRCAAGGLDRAARVDVEVERRHLVEEARAAPRDRDVAVAEVRPERSDRSREERPHVGHRPRGDRDRGRCGTLEDLVARRAEAVGAAPRREREARVPGDRRHTGAARGGRRQRRTGRRTARRVQLDVLVDQVRGRLDRDRPDGFGRQARRRRREGLDRVQPVREPGRVVGAGPVRESLPRAQAAAAAADLHRRARQAVAARVGDESGDLPAERRPAVPHRKQEAALRQRVAAVVDQAGARVRIEE